MATPYPTQARLKELFDYNPDTGELTRLITSGPNALIGEVTKGTLSVKGYYRIQVDGVQYLVHRLAWILVYGSIPSHLQIDHINRDRADNRILNLRLATNAQNQQNKTIDSRNKSGYAGVFWYAKKQTWTAKIKVNKVTIHLGTFRDLDQAVKVRKMAEKKYFTHAPVTPELIE